MLVLLQSASQPASLAERFDLLELPLQSSRSLESRPSLEHVPTLGSDRIVAIVLGADIGLDKVNCGHRLVGCRGTFRLIFE